MAVNKISGETLAAMRRKSAAALPDRPSQRGYTPDEIRRTMWGVLFDATNSFAAEMARMAEETNQELDSMAKHIVSQTIMIESGEWYDEDAFRASVQVRDAGPGTLTFLLPANRHTQEIANALRLQVDCDLFENNKDKITIIRFGSEAVLHKLPGATEPPILFRAYTVKTGGTEYPRACLVGVDPIPVVLNSLAGAEDQTEYALSAALTLALVKREISEALSAYEPGGGGGVDEAAVRTIVLDVLAGRTAADLGAEEMGAVRRHDASTEAHPNLLAKIATALDEISKRLKAHNEAIDAHEDIRESLSLEQQRIDSVIRKITSMLETDTDTLARLQALTKSMDEHGEDATAQLAGKLDRADLITTEAEIKAGGVDKVASAAVALLLYNRVNAKITSEEAAKLIAEALKSYAPIAHNHDGKYQPVGNYADAGHLHGEYQPRETGKGLSTHDYTTADKDRVAAAITDDRIAHEAGSSPTKVASQAMVTDLVAKARTETKAEIMATIAEKPIVAQSFFSSGEADTTKNYVCKETNTVWSYMYVDTWINALPTAAAEPGGTEVYGGVGYKIGYRVNASNGGEITSDTTASITGYISAKPGETVYLKNIVFDDQNVGNGCIVPVYRAPVRNADGTINIASTIIKGMHLRHSVNNSALIKKASDGEYYFTIPETADYAETAYFRAQFSLNTEDPSKIIISVGREIVGEESSYRWVDTGVKYGFDADAYLALSQEVADAKELAQEALEQGGADGAADLPSYWAEHAAAKVQEIKQAQRSFGQRCVTWAAIADIHDGSNQGYSGKLLRYVCDACGIGAVLVLGDLSTRATKQTRDEAVQTIGNAHNLLAEIRDRVLAVRGNHDGGYTSGDALLLKPSEVDDLLLYPMTTRLEITYDAVGSGYYADDRGAKVRFVMLNTCHRGADPDSTVGASGASDYPYMSFYRYTQVQAELVKTALSTVPSDAWSVVVASHIPPVGQIDRYGDGTFTVDLSTRLQDYLAMRSILNAYVGREAKTVTFAGTAAWDKINISVDFTAAKGHLVEYQAGHLHKYLFLDADHVDPKSGTELGFPVRVLRSDGFNENYDDTNESQLDDAYAAQRIAGASSEQSCVVCVHGIDTKETFCIHIGVQEEET